MASQDVVARGKEAMDIRSVCIFWRCTHQQKSFSSGASTSKCSRVPL